MDYRALAERMQHTIKRRPPLSTEVRRVLQALMVTLSLLFLGMSVVFLYQTSKSAEQSFLLRQTRLENEKQKSENRELKQKVLQVQSFQNISESEVLEKMDEMTAPVYLPPKKVTVREKS